MQLARKFRIPALFCALAVLFCDLVSRPFANMGIADDGPYILMAQKLAATGHVFYNAWATAMIGWQLYLGAAFIKLFGYSFTAVRMSTLLVAMALAFVFQRALVLADISEWNATIATLTLVLSPLFLVLSVTFMTDIHGLFAIVLCLYGCLRALRASTSRAAIGWLCFAVATNAICGSSRQIAWLGVLVMVPSALWLLRAQRRVLFAGAATTLAGALFILGCMHWLKQQPYSIPEHLLPDSFPVFTVLRELTYVLLDIPYRLLPIAVLFLPQLRKSRPRLIAILCVVFLAYLFMAIYPSHLRGNFPMEPVLGDWFSTHGIFEYMVLTGEPPTYLNRGMRAVLTIVAFGSLLGLIASLLRFRRMPKTVNSSSGISWKQLGVLLGPFTIAYIVLLIPRATGAGIHDRYTLGLLVVALLCIVRYYQDRIRPRLPVASIVLVGIVAICSITLIHNTFSLYRARVALAAELRSAGIPDTSVDNGWEYNLGVELQHADYINLPVIAVPAHAYVPTPPLPAGTCSMFLYDQTPHIRPLYSVSFDPHGCSGPAPFAPVHYSRWPYRTPGTLYVVHSSRIVPKESAPTR